MLTHQIEIAKNNLRGMVKVNFRDGMTMHVNVSDTRWYT